MCKALNRTFYISSNGKFLKQATGAVLDVVDGKDTAANS